MHLAIIPARGGSKRIPRKNIKDFFSKPLIAHSIENALNSGIFKDVIVSTDDDEISKIAKKLGAKVPFLRPSELSDDYTGTSDVVRHAIKFMEEKNINYKSVCCLYATAPLINEEILKKAFLEFTSKNIDFLFSVADFNYPIQRALKLDKEQRVEMFYPEFSSSRSQDLEKAYHDAGGFYFGKTKAWLENKSIFSKNSQAFILPRNFVCDIDSMEDFEFAKILYSQIKK